MQIIEVSSLRLPDTGTLVMLTKFYLNFTHSSPKYIQLLTPLFQKYFANIPLPKLPTGTGPDGFTVSYFKTFSDLLTPLLMGAFNHIIEGQSFHQETLLALISMPQTDHTTWSDYRPF